MTLSDTLGIIGAFLSLIGFGVALWQIGLAKKEVRRAISIAEATKEAVDETHRLAAINELLLLIPQMQRLDRDLNQAVAASDRHDVLTYLSDWRAIAPQASGAFSVHDHGVVDLRSRLAESATIAATTIADLADPQTDVTTATKRAVTVIAGACEQAGYLLGQLKVQPGGTTQS